VAQPPATPNPALIWKRVAASVMGTISGPTTSVGQSAPLSDRDGAQVDDP
jgi:hypothetical protein